MSALWLAPFVQLTLDALAENLCLIGGHGSGKSGVLRGWLEQILAQAPRCIVHDVKGDVTARLPTDDFLLIAPHDRRSWVWSIGKDITHHQDAKELAAKLISTDGSEEAIWSKSARELLAALVHVLQRKHGTHWSWEHLYAAVFQTPLKIRTQLESINSPAARLIEIDDSGGVSRTSLSMLLTLWVAALSAIVPIVKMARHIPQKRRFSVREWLSQQSKLPKIIVMQSAADYPELSAMLNGLLVEIVAGAILAPSSLNQSKPWLYLVLDELPVLKKLKRLPEILNVGREKGVRTICATQDWEQIIKYYGDEDANTLDERFGIKVVSKITSGKTRKRVLNFEEDRTIREWFSAGKDRPRTHQDRGHPVITAEQLSQELGVYKSWRGKRVEVRVAVFGLGPAAILNIPLTAWPERRDAHAPLPTTKLQANNSPGTQKKRNPPLPKSR
jgi:hypothetical protein